MIEIAPGQPQPTQPVIVPGPAVGRRASKKIVARLQLIRQIEGLGLKAVGLLSRVGRERQIAAIRISAPYCRRDKPSRGLLLVHVFRFALRQR